MKPRVTYRGLEKDPSYEHAVDQTVRLRIGRRDLQLIVATKTDAIVKALGAKKRLWFDFEAAADELRAKRESAYFNVGVEHGIAACAVHGLGRLSKRVRVHAQHVVQELLRTGVARQDAVRAAMVAAWALLGRSQRIDA
jgi:hypothetical protein